MGAGGPGPPERGGGGGGLHQVLRGVGHGGVRLEQGGGHAAYHCAQQGAVGDADCQRGHQYACQRAEHEVPERSEVHKHFRKEVPVQPNVGRQVVHLRHEQQARNIVTHDSAALWWTPGLPQLRHAGG